MKKKFLSIVLLVLVGLFIIQCYKLRQQQQYMNTQFVEEIAEQQAYHAIASAYLRQLHPELSWDECLLKTQVIMIPTKKWILKELKEQKAN